MALPDEYPRVEHLTYRVSHGPGWEYQATATAEGKLGDFDFRIADKRATFKPQIRFESEDAARKALDPRLAAWELSATLARGADCLRFVFEHCHVRRAPPRPGVAEVEGVCTVTVTGQAVALVLTSNYVLPDASIGVNDLVETIRARYEALLRGESLHHHGNAILTRVERKFGSRAEAAAQLEIAFPVLKALGEMLANRGSADEVRKFSKGFTGAPLTESEKAWMRAVLRAILERAARKCAGTLGPPALTMADLPPR